MDKQNYINEYAPQSQQPHMHRFSNGEPSGVSVELIHSLLGVNSGLPGNHISGLQQPPQPVNRQQYTNVPLPSLDISQSIVNTISNNRQSNTPSNNNSTAAINNSSTNLSNSNSNSTESASALLEQLTIANPNLLNSILGTQQAHLVGNPFLFGLSGSGTGCGGGNSATSNTNTNFSGSNTGPLMSVYQQNNNNSTLNNHNPIIGNQMGFQSIAQNLSNFPSAQHQYSQQQFPRQAAFNNNQNLVQNTEDVNPSEDELNELIIEQQKHINLLENELVQARELISKLNDYVRTLEQKAAAGKKQSRYWTQDEHQRFLEAIEKFGKKDVKAIAQYVGTRNATQVRTHAQKFYAKLDRDKHGDVDTNKKKKKRSNKEGEESSSPPNSVDEEQEEEEEEEAEPLFIDNRPPAFPMMQQRLEHESIGFETKQESVQ